MKRFLLLVLLAPVAFGAKPSKPDYALQSDLDAVAAEVATLDSEVAGLSAQVNQNSTDIASLQENPPVFPRPFVIDSNGAAVGFVQELLTGDYWEQFDVSASDPDAAALAWVDIGDGYVPLIAHREFLRGNQRVYFDGVNCTGNVYIGSASVYMKPDERLVDFLQYAVLEDGTVLKADYSQAASTLTVSYLQVRRDGWDDGWLRSCVNNSSGNPMYTATVIGQLPSIAAPYRIEVR